MKVHASDVYICAARQFKGLICDAQDFYLSNYSILLLGLLQRFGFELASKCEKLSLFSLNLPLVIALKIQLADPPNRHDK